MNSETLITATDIEKSFLRGKTLCPILKGIDLEVRRGEFLAIVGPSGAGKSTLLHILGLLSSPTKGEIHWEKTRMDRLGAEALSQWRNKRVGFVFQFHHLLPEFTAWANVMMPSLVRRTASQDLIESRSKTLLNKAGLGNRLAHRPSELSGGEQQRVALARALMNEPEILLADEPTGNLDRANADAVFQLLQELQKEKGLTLVMVTHHEGYSKKASRVVRMEDGRISKQA